jgi:type I restriction enzyme S subunit
MSDLCPPTGWSLKTLGELAQVVSGSTPSRENILYWHGGTIPWVTPTDITGNHSRTLTSTAEKITPQGLASCAAQLLPVGSLLMTSRATLGEIKIAGTEVCTNQGFKSLVPRSLIDGWYLFYQMQMSKERYSLLGKGSTFLEVNKWDTESFKILYAPLVEQRKIARILTTVDNLIEKTEALIAKYQAIKQGMMHDLFTRGVDEHGHLRPPYEEAPELYKQSELGWIPKEWEVCNGESLADLITKGESPTWQGFDYQDDGVLFVTSENVREGFIDLSTPKFIPVAFDSKLYRSRLAHGDVLINLVGASIGRSCRVPDSIGRANINQAVCLFRAKSVVLSNWIAYYFQLPEVMTRLTGEQVETARANVSLTDVREFKFPVPSDDEMRQVIRSLGTADKAALSERAILGGLGKQKTGLMQDLLTGKVRVKADESEEVGHV